MPSPLTEVPENPSRSTLSRCPKRRPLAFTSRSLLSFITQRFARADFLVLAESSREIRCSLKGARERLFVLRRLQGVLERWYLFFGGSSRSSSLREKAVEGSDADAVH